MANVSALWSFRWFLIVLIVVAWLCSVKGACHHYGHACLGAHGKKRSGLQYPSAVATSSEFTDEQDTNDDETMDPSRSRIKWLAIPRGRQILMMPLPSRWTSQYILPQIGGD